MLKRRESLKDNPPIIAASRDPRQIGWHGVLSGPAPYFIAFSLCQDGYGEVSRVPDMRDTGFEVR